MTKVPEKTVIKNAINTYCAAKGFSKNKLSKETGINVAILSNIENNKWDDILQTTWNSIWRKVNLNADAELVTTKDYRSAENACQFARNNSYMVGLIADTGMGKTTALVSYSHRKNTFYVKYDKTMRPRQFFEALLRAMGIGFEGNINEMVGRIADELNVMDAPLVIVDEAGKLTHTMIMYLQVLKDNTHLACGYVLAGMPYFKSNLIKLSNKEKEGYAEFYRRVNLWQTLEGLTRDEIKYICEQHGVTNPDQQREFYHKKRFGDLVNALLLKKLTQNN